MPEVLSHQKRINLKIECLDIEEAMHKAKPEDWLTPQDLATA